MDSRPTRSGIRNAGRRGALLARPVVRVSPFKTRRPELLGWDRSPAPRCSPGRWPGLAHSKAGKTEFSARDIAALYFLTLPKRQDFASPVDGHTRCEASGRSFSAPEFGTQVQVRRWRCPARDAPCFTGNSLSAQDTGEHNQSRSRQTRYYRLASPG